MPISSFANNPQIPQPFPLNQRSLKVTPAINGMFGECGNAGAGAGGVWAFMWVPDNSFVDSLIVMGRIAGIEAANDGVPLVQIPYRADYLNSGPTGSPLSYNTTVITGTSLFYVDSWAKTAGLIFECTQGFGMLYTLDTNTGNS